MHRYLHRHYPHLKIGIADQKKVEPEIDSPVKLHLGKNYLQSLQNYGLIIRSPGISLQFPEVQQAKAAGKKITSATNIFFSNCPGKIIGVTGTLGKSTTSSLIAAILSEKYQDVQLAGNIGFPMIDHLDKATPKTIFVLELSSFQLEDINYSPHIAVLLNIVPEHLDRHKTFTNYVRAKANIIRCQTRKDFVVFNPEHKILAKIAKKAAAKKVNFSLEPNKDSTCFFHQGKIFVRKKNKTNILINRNKVSLLGKGNTENIMAAVSVGLILNVPLPKIKKALSKFNPLEHRIEYLGTCRGIKFYNDSISTVPESAIHALDALDNKVDTLIAGGFDRGLNFSKLAKRLSKTKVKNLILFPTTGKKIWQSIVEQTPAKKRPKKFAVSSMQEAVETAFAVTGKGKICLLSPASASFGLFKDYRERGNLFKKFVLKQKNEL